MKKLFWLFGLGLVSQSEGCWWFDCCSGKGDVSTDKVNIDSNQAEFIEPNQSIYRITMLDLIKEIQILTQQTHILERRTDTLREKLTKLALENQQLKNQQNYPSKNRCGRIKKNKLALHRRSRSLL